MPGAEICYKERVTLGTLISSVRKARRLTQPELGAAMDPPRSASTVAKWEADDRSPDSDQLREICRMLHVSADVLLERAPFELLAMPAAKKAP